MDPVRNPYAPGAGTPPPELAGRSEIIADATVSLRRTAIGRGTQSPILVGLRGVGKTVLLVKIKDIADGKDFTRSRSRLMREDCLRSFFCLASERLLFRLAQYRLRWRLAAAACAYCAASSAASE